MLLMVVVNSEWIMLLLPHCGGGVEARAGQNRRGRAEG